MRQRDDKGFPLYSYVGGVVVPQRLDALFSLSATGRVAVAVVMIMIMR